MSPASFPIGSAGTMRKLALAKGLLANGYGVHVISTINNGSGSCEIRNYQGITYNCTAPNKAWGGGNLQKLGHLLSGFVNGLVFVFKDAKNHDQVLLTTNQYDLKFSFFVWLVARISGSFLFTELNENPLITRENLSSSRMQLRKLNVWLSLKLYDKIFVMTHNIKKLLCDEYGIKRDITILNNAVDFDRFGDSKITPLEHTIGYAGSLSYRKDSLDVLVEALAIAKRSLPNIKLRICYFSTDTNFSQFMELVKTLKLTDSVEMIPDLPNDKIPDFLASSSILVIIRIPNQQTEYGFPTKLVEYLASGRPVIVTPVSDIPLFLTHLRDVYIVNNIDAESVAQAICYLFNQRNADEVIGMNGKLACQIHFNPEIEAKKIATAHVKWLKQKL